MRHKAAFVRTLIFAVGFTMMASDALALGALQEKDTLFAGAEKFSVGAKATTEVNLDKKMLALASAFGGGDVADKDQLNLVKKMDFVIVRSYEYAKAGDYKMADVEEFTRRLDTDGWSHIVKERTAKSSTDVCIKADNEGQMSELVVIDAEPMELTFVHLKGHMAMNDLMKAGSKYGVPQGDPKLQKR